MKNLILLTGLTGALFATDLALAQNPPTTNVSSATAETKDAARPDPATGDQTPQPPDAPDASATPVASTPAAVAPAPAAVARAPVAPAPMPVPVAPAVAPVAIATSPAVTVPATSTNSMYIPGTHEKGLRMNFRGVPLETVLNYMSDAAGFIIHPKVDIRGKVDVWSAQPLSPDEAVKLLKQILNENGYTAMQDGRTLTIIRSEDAKKSTIAVHSGSNPEMIPNNAEIVTQIIPVHTLNVVQLVKDLEPLRPTESTLTADESANSLVMTDTQSSIKHITEIVKALDSVTSSSAVVRVFPLKYADSKAIATLMKDLFPSAETSTRTGSSTPGVFPGFGGFGGDRGRGERGSRGGNEADSGSGHTPTAKVNAVSDDHSNSLVVSAPEEVMSTIDQLIKQVDTPVEDETQVKLFHLKNADATEMAELITALFPDDSSSSDATRGRFGFFFPGQQPASSSSSSSDRMKKMSHVGVAADRRTSSIVITAGKELMPQISTMIDELDARKDRKMTMHVIHLNNADPVDIQTILQDLISTTGGSSGGSRSGGSSASSSSTSNPLLNRQTTLLQQQNSASASTSGTIGGTSSRGN